MSKLVEALKRAEQLRKQKLAQEELLPTTGLEGVSTSPEQQIEAAAKAGVAHQETHEQLARQVITEDAAGTSAAAKRDADLQAAKTANERRDAELAARVALEKRANADRQAAAAAQLRADADAAAAAAARARAEMELAAKAAADKKLAAEMEAANTALERSEATALADGAATLRIAAEQRLLHETSARVAAESLLAAKENERSALKVALAAATDKTLAAERELAAATTAKIAAVEESTQRIAIDLEKAAHAEQQVRGLAATEKAARLEAEKQSSHLATSQSNQLINSKLPATPARSADRRGQIFVAATAAMLLAGVFIGARFELPSSQPPSVVVPAAVTANMPSSKRPGASEIADLPVILKLDVQLRRLPRKNSR